MRVAHPSLPIPHPISVTSVQGQIAIKREAYGKESETDRSR